MPGSQTTQGRTGTRAHAPAHVAFCFFESIGTPNGIFAAQWLAYTLPCQRFAYALMGIHA
jgi:hypothetical protein